MIEKKLLLVDDEELILKNLSAILERSVKHIDTALDGIKALELIKKTEFDCIVCDINMPNMNGIELIKTLREMGNNVPFIFFTGHGCRDLMLEAVKYGAFDFIDKPNLENIEEIVLRGLNSSSSGREKVEDSEEFFSSEFQKLMDETGG